MWWPCSIVLYFIWLSRVITLALRHSPAAPLRCYVYSHSCQSFTLYPSSSCPAFKLVFKTYLPPMSFSAVCIRVCVCVCVCVHTRTCTHLIGIVCAHNPMCVCTCACTHKHVCACILSCFVWKCLFIFVCLFTYHWLVSCIHYAYLSIPCFSLSCKVLWLFESLKVLHKFPINSIIIYVWICVNIICNSTNCMLNNYSLYFNVHILLIVVGLYCLALWAAG